MAQVAIDVRMAPELVPQVASLTEALGRVADNQEKIVALQDENQRLLTEIVGSLSERVPELIECASSATSPRLAAVPAATAAARR